MPALRPRNKTLESPNPRDPRDVALVRNALRACNAQLGRDSLGATRFRHRAEHFLAGERLGPFELRGFIRCVQEWTTGKARMTVPRADVVALARRAFALVGHARTYGAPGVGAGASQVRQVQP